MTIKIRPMRRQDKSPIMQMLKVTPEFKPFEVIVAEEVCDSYLKDPVGSGYHITVAEEEKKVTGYICYGPAPLTEGTWDIYWMAVFPNLQGRGIGKKLLAFAEKNIKESLGRLILIETSSKSNYEKTRQFYYSQGYRTVCTIPDFYAPEDDKVILHKRLK